MDADHDRELLYQSTIGSLFRFATDSHSRSYRSGTAVVRSIVYENEANSRMKLQLQGVYVRGMEDCRR